LQQETPDDYVIATGEQHSVREFLEVCAGELSFFDFVQWVKKNLSQTIDPCGGGHAVFPSLGSGNPAE